mgnify:CR=1 FL=1
MAEAAASAQRVAEVTLVVGAVAEAVETVAEDVEAVVDGVAVPSAVAVVGAEHNLLLQHSHNLPPVLQPHHPKYLLSQ